MSKCKHDEGVYTKRKVSIYQYYDEFGSPSNAEFVEFGGKKNGEIAYCAKCEKRLGKAEKLINFQGATK